MSQARGQVVDVLLLEDRTEDAELIQRELRKLTMPYAVRWVLTPASYAEALEAAIPDLILSDHNIPQYSGREALALARQVAPRVPFILVTSSLSEEAAVDYIKAGAGDYVIKDRILRLVPAIESAIERARALQDAEEEIREREALFSSLVLASPLAIFQTDARGFATYITPKWTEITGRSLEETLGEGWAAAVHPDDLPRVTAEWQIRLSDHRPSRLEYRIVRPGGEIRSVHVNTASVLRADGTPAGYVGTVEDVTERKNLEVQFRQAQKMEGVGQLAGGVAHDFNNLLTAILGYSELIQEDLDPRAPQQEHVGEVIALTHRAATLTRQLLAFSRQQVLEPRSLDLNHLVADVYKILGRLIREDVEIVTTFAPHLGRVMADPGQLEQVIVNLAVNARDAMPDGGRITIETANVDLDQAYIDAYPIAQLGPHVLLTVSDTGMGMSEEVKRKIFEPFFTTKEVGKGTGLGLATVYGIVKQSNGWILVYSEPGEGTTFKIYLPQLQDAREDAAPEVPGHPRVARGSETILLVEDEGTVRKIAHQVLRRYGYTVLTANNGEEALAVFVDHGEKIDLLITDVIMPRLAGRPLVQQVRQSFPACRVLFMSGYAADAVIRHGVLEPGTAFLVKPFTATGLAMKVREVLDTPRHPG